MVTNDKKNPSDKEYESKRISGGLRDFWNDHSNLYPMFNINKEQEHEAGAGAGAEAESKMTVETISVDQLIDDLDDELQKDMSYTVESPRSDSNPAGAGEYCWDTRNDDMSMAVSDYDDDDDDDESSDIQKALFLSMTSNYPPKKKLSPEEKLKGVVRSPELTPHDYNWFNERLMFNPPRCFNEAKTSSYVPMSVCCVCSDQQPQGNMLILSKSCKHSTCHSCIQSHLWGWINGNIHELTCPDAGCEHVLDRDAIYHRSPEMMKSRWLESLRETLALANPEYFQCPFWRCEKTFMSDKKTFNIKACPNCNIVFCVQCKVRFHMGSTCQQYQARLEAQRIEREEYQVRLENRRKLEKLRVLLYPYASRDEETEDEADV